MTNDWVRWHEPYDDPGSSLHRRLLRVQRRVAAALEQPPPGPVAVLSMCAGEARDLLPVLAVHPRRDDVTALLVELDPRVAARAGATARATGLDGVRVVVGDAASTSAYAEVVPVDVALVCGVFGNVPDGDVRRTVHLLPTLLRPGGTVVWTRHRREPDLTPAIRRWFTEAGFVETGYDCEPGFLYGVGVHTLVGPARPFAPGTTMFHFAGDGAEAEL